MANQPGKHWTYIGGIERGERNPTLVVIADLAKGLRVKVGELLEWWRTIDSPNATLFITTLCFCWNVSEGPSGRTAIDWSLKNPQRAISGQVATGQVPEIGADDIFAIHSWHDADPSIR